ncbi:hypothetical protein [Hyphococcus sp.]|uniref:hypothetical protein n=1 Tax=Hyphococcus sp. TaxID=2038636 RepID=UPI002086CC83|nr:MAG: hypothetical protein DHS20C04_30800 [Marinicaulis sp.]
MSWEITTYESAKASIDPSAVLSEKEVNGVVRTQCPCCRAWVLPHVLIDLRGFPAAFRETLPGGAEWACDGCWTKWQATGKPTGDGRAFNEAILYEFSGAPAAFVEKVGAIISARVARAAHSHAAIGVAGGLSDSDRQSRDGIRHLSE